MRITTAIAISAGFLAVGNVSAWAECPAELAKVEKAMQSSSLQDMEAAVRRLPAAMTCDPWEETKADAMLSARLITEAKKVDPALKQPQAVALIERAAQPALEWRSLELLGRIQRSAGKFREATLSFQQAINLIANTDAEEKTRREGKGNIAPAGVWKNEATREERARLVTQADEAKHLAAAGQGVLVVASSDRAGNPGGVFSAAVDRGAVGVRVPVPILFDYNSAQLSKVGTEAAQEFLSFLKKRDPKSITITGHTDRVGGEAYNLDLSKRRAATVAAFLKDNGIGGKIVTVGKGFAEPWKTSEGASYTQAQIDELNRRVEFDWN